MSSVDESVCGVNSVLAAGVLDRCGVDSLVADEASDSSGGDVGDDVVACGDATLLLSDAFRVGGCVPVVGVRLAQPEWVVPCSPSHHRCTQCVFVVFHR